MRSLRRAPLALAVVVALAVAPAGCGSSSTGQTSTATTGNGKEARPPRATSSSAGAPAGSRVKKCNTSALSSPGLQVAGASCTTARGTLLAWKRDGSCSSPPGASRYACTVNGFRCLGLNADRGIAVSCANGGEEVAFIAKPG